MLHCPMLPLTALRGQIKFIEIEKVDKVLGTVHTWVLEEGVEKGVWTLDTSGTSADYFGMAKVLAMEGEGVAAFKVPCALRYRLI